jgi:hypothetical protein
MNGIQRVNTVASTAADASAVILGGADKDHVALPACLAGGGKRRVSGRIKYHESYRECNIGGGGEFWPCPIIKNHIVAKRSVAHQAALAPRKERLDDVESFVKARRKVIQNMSMDI